MIRILNFMMIHSSILGLGVSTSEIKFNGCSRVCEPGPNLCRALEQHHARVLDHFKSLLKHFGGILASSCGDQKKVHLKEALRWELAAGFDRTQSASPDRCEVVPH